ncbi:transposase, partial [Candidatus Woesearchaeota archaeon]|nr:transposase [Candidatus Woesearchaeota archaeon]
MLKEFSRTIRIPVHYKITKSKINKLNKITAKLTYAIKLFSDKIKETNQISRKELSRYEKEIQKTTKLSSA